MRIKYLNELINYYYTCNEYSKIANSKVSPSIIVTTNCLNKIISNEFIYPGTNIEYAKNFMRH